MALRDTTKLIFALKLGYGLRLDTAEGRQMLFVFLSSAYARGLVTKRANVPLFFLCGLESAGELITETDNNVLNQVFIPLNQDPVKWFRSDDWATIVEEFWHRCPDDEIREELLTLSSEAIVGYEKKIEGSFVSREFDEAECVRFIQKVRQRRLAIMVEKAKKMFNFTEEEVDVLNRLMRMGFSCLEDEPRTQAVVRQINQKVGFEWLVDFNEE